MKHLQSTEVVDLPGNNFGDKGAGAIIENLNNHVKVLNLDNNKIGKIGIENLI